MIELPLIFLGGLLGSSHCIGMCGGFAVMIGAGASKCMPALTRQLLYSAGRLFTYATLGATAGYVGDRFTLGFSNLPDTQAMLSIAAGLLLISQGLISMGFLRRRAVKQDKSCLAAGMLRSFLVLPGGWNYFAAGLFTGFLPCGLVYAYLALAASSRGLVHGMAIMAAFGSGTVPLMVATGAGGALLSISNRARILRLAAWCIVVTGMITLARGAYRYTQPAGGPTKVCPVCREARLF